MKENTKKSADKNAHESKKQPGVPLSKKLIETKKKSPSKPVVGKLDECAKAHVAETYRLEDEDDACNDSVQ